MPTWCWTGLKSVSWVEWEKKKNSQQWTLTWVSAQLQHRHGDLLNHFVTGNFTLQHYFPSWSLSPPVSKTHSQNVGGNPLHEADVFSSESGNNEDRNANDAFCCGGDQSQVAEYFRYFCVFFFFFEASELTTLCSYRVNTSHLHNESCLWIRGRTAVHHILHYEEDACSLQSLSFWLLWLCQHLWSPSHWAFCLWLAVIWFRPFMIPPIEIFLISSL